MTPEQAREHAHVVEGLDALHIFNPIRGGLSGFFAPDGSRLVAGSAVRYDDHLAEFKKGRRN